MSSPFREMVAIVQACARGKYVHRINIAAFDEVDRALEYADRMRVDYSGSDFRVLVKAGRRWVPYKGTIIPLDQTAAR